MSDEVGSLTKAVIYSGCAFLIIEAVYNIIEEAKTKGKGKTTLSQAKIWVRSLLMIALGIIIFFFSKNIQIQA